MAATTPQIDNPTVYAVRTGRTCGLFTDVAELHKSVMDFHGAEFNQFKTVYEADRYLYQYCQLYACSPPLAKELCVVQAVSQDVVVGNVTRKLASVACYGNAFTAVSSDCSLDQIQITAVLEILKKLQDVPAQGILVGGLALKADGTALETSDYTVDAWRQIQKLADAASVSVETKSVETKSSSDSDNQSQPTCLPASAFETNPTMLRYVAENTFDALYEIYKINKSRKHPVAIAPANGINALYFVRVALFSACNNMGLMANDLAKQHDAKQQTQEAKQQPPPPPVPRRATPAPVSVAAPKPVPLATVAEINDFLSEQETNV